MKLLQRSDSTRSNSQNSKRFTITRFFSNLSLSTRNRSARPASVSGYGTYPAGRQSEQIDRGSKGEHGLLSRASFDALGSKFSRSRKTSFGAASMLDMPTRGPLADLGPVVDISRQAERAQTPKAQTTPSFNLHHTNSLFGLTPIRDIESPHQESPYSMMHLSDASSCPPSPSFYTRRRSSAPSPDSAIASYAAQHESPTKAMMCVATSGGSDDGSAELKPIERSSDHYDLTNSQNLMAADDSRVSLSDRSASSTPSVSDSASEKVSMSSRIVRTSPIRSRIEPFPQPPTTTRPIPMLCHQTLPPSSSMNVIPPWLLEDSLDHLFRNTPPSSPHLESPKLLSPDWRAQWITSPGEPAEYSVSSIEDTPSPPAASSPEDVAQIVVAQRKKLVKRKAVPLPPVPALKPTKASRESFDDSMCVRTPRTPEFGGLSPDIPLESSKSRGNAAVRLVTKYRPAPNEEGSVPDFASVFDQSSPGAGLQAELQDDLEEEEWDGTYGSEGIDFDGASDQSEDDRFDQGNSFNQDNSFDQDDSSDRSCSDSFAFNSTLSDQSTSSFGSQGTTIVHPTPPHHSRNPRESIGGAIDRLLEDVGEWTMGTAIRVSPLKIRPRGQVGHDLDIGRPTTRLQEESFEDQESDVSVASSTYQATSTGQSEDGNESGIRLILNRKSSISSDDLTIQARQIMEKTREERRARRMIQDDQD